jgi:hypothetical protein
MTNGGMRLRSGIQTSLLEEGLREVKYKLEVIPLTPFEGGNQNLTSSLIIPN